MAHLVDWFIDLNDGRTYTIIAGMGGGSVIPNAITWQELSAWSSITGNDPTAFETKALREMDKAWRVAYDQGQGSRGKGQKTAQHQGLGDYCKGEHLEQCKKNFGNGLELACSSCPN